MKPDRTFTGEAFDRLLAALDPDRERAGQAYVLLRRKLVSFFEWRGAANPEECADETLNVAARRIAGGEQVRNLVSYCAGVARMILLEQHREQGRFTPILEDPPSAPPEDGAGDDLQMRCLEHCLDALPAESRELVLAYYQGGPGTAIEARKALARRLGIAPNALRIRAHRVRVRLEESVRALMVREPGSRETN
jgi:DNA-directed RNA polymerase specialized sigma24 family protein